MLETFEVNKVLIIAPLRVARDTWSAEIEKWNHLKGLDISVIVGDVKTRIAAVHHPAMIYIVNRENIKWLVEYYEKNGMRWDFSMVVIDELSSFKNYQSQRFKFLRKVRPFVKRWVGLTGTPSSNGLMDLWAEIFVFFFPDVVAVVNVQLVFFFKLCDALLDDGFDFGNGLFHGLCPPFLVWFSLLSLCV